MIKKQKRMWVDLLRKFKVREIFRRGDDDAVHRHEPRQESDLQ